MRFLFLVNGAEEIQPSQTTAMLIAAAARHHRVWVAGVGDLCCRDNGDVWAYARPVKAEWSRCLEDLVTALASTAAKAIALHSSTLDIVFIRTNPARDLVRSAIHQTALALLRLVEDGGVKVINQPDGLIRAATKLYLLELPPFTRPSTLVSSNRADILSFIHALAGPAVLKPLQGTRGNDVFFVTSATEANLNQIIDVIFRQGLVMVQQQIPGAEAGDTRVVVMNGEVLVINGQPAAIQRVPKRGDLRSNIHAGGTARQGVVTEAMQKVVTAIGPKLVADGLFLVGLDFIGAQLVEINVFSTGGLRDAEKFTGAAFANRIIQVLAASQ